MTGRLQRPVIRGLVKIFDAGFVDERAAAVSHLDAIAVIPFDITFDLLAIFQHENHQGLAVDLLLEIKSFRMRALSRHRGVPPAVDYRNGGECGTTPGVAGR